MNARKVLGVVGAIVIAAIGTILLVAYVDNAEERALEGEELVEVYRVDGAIDAGTPAEEIAGNVATELVPRKVVPADAIADLTSIAGLVSSVDLVPGEQLLTSRFVDPVSYQRDAGRLAEIPPGLQEVTLSLEPERAGGAGLLPGDTVGVYASFEPFDISSEVPVEIDGGTVIPPNGRTPNTTRILLHKVLVTNVQLEELPGVEELEPIGDQNGGEVRLAPTGNLLVSLAVDTFDGERLVYAAEFGTVWLSLQPASAAEEPSLIQTRGTVYVDRLDPSLRVALETAPDNAADGAGNG